MPKLTHLRRIWLLIWLTVGTGSGLKAQDLIVTIKRDTIHCRIEKANEQFVYYRTVRTRRGEVDLISRKEVKELIYAAEASIIKANTKLESSQRYEKLMLWGGGGISLILENTDNVTSTLKQYYDDLYTGYWYGFGANYFLTREIGVGIQFTASDFSNSIEVQQSNPQGVVIRQGTLSDNIALRYYAANGIIKLFDDNSTWYSLHLNGGLGLLTYRNDAVLFNGYTVSGSTIGLHASLEFNLSLGQGMYIGAHGALRGIGLPKASIEFSQDMPDDLRQSLRSSLDESLPFNLARLEAGLVFSVLF